MNFKQNILPHLIAILVFLLVSIIYYHPIVFENKVLNQNDINQGAGSASEIVKFREETGNEALWTNSMFSGMPAYHISLLWSGGEFLNEIQKLIGLYMPVNVRENLLAFIGFYILLLAFGVKPYLAITGALAYGLSTFFVISIGAGHLWKVRAIAYMPAVLAGIHLVFSGKRLWGFLLTALALALEINANHLQITYYLLIMVLIYGIIQLIYAIKSNDLIPFLSNTATLSIAALLAIIINIGHLWTSVEYSKYSIRGKSELTQETAVSSGLNPDYAFNWSSGKWESMTMLVPNLYGGGSGRYNGSSSELSRVLRRNNVPANQINQYIRGTLGYWGNQPGTAGPVYVGAIICFLFVLGLFYVDRKILIWIIIITFLGIILSWGKNFSSFNYLVFDYFPAYNKFRAVTMTVVMAMLVIPLLGLIGLKQILLSGWNPHVRKNMFISLGIVGGILLLIALFPNPPKFTNAQIPEWFSNAVDQDRVSIIRMDVFRSLFFVLATFSIIILVLKEKINDNIFAAILIVLVILDLGLVNSRFLNKNDFVRKQEMNFFAETEADKKILNDQRINYRVLNLQSPFTEARTSVFHKSIGGYHGAKMRRYQDLVEKYLSPEIQAIINNQRINAETMPVLNMLNTRYIMAGYQPNAIIENQDALGNAWFVKELKSVNSPDEEIKSISTIDPGNTAIVDKTLFQISDFEYSPDNFIELTKYQPNYLKYSLNTNMDGLAVFSEVYYPVGWQASIDGKPVEIKRVNYILRALEVPAGSKEIEFVFKPNSYYIGNKVTIAGIGLYILLFAIGGFQMYHQYKTRKPNPED